MISYQANSQTEKSLLWEISGNGLQKSSYLFGTIHITNKQVFDLPDSVLPKLTQSDVVAMELNLDSVSNFMLTNMNFTKSYKRLNQLLNQKELNHLKKVYKEKFNEDLDVDDKTAWDVYKKDEEQNFKNKDMSTFLDAYLFGIGKNWNRNMIGLETFEEQLSVFENLKETEQREMALSITDSNHNNEKMKDSMIVCYMNQDLNGLYKLMTDATTKDFEERLLTKRNYRMCLRIDSIIKTQTLFTAVGAGHLPGKEGLIELLRKKGYTVTPMISAKTGYYKNYIRDEKLADWKTITDDVAGFKVQMPGDASNMNFMGFEMKGYFDFGSGYFFLATGVPIAGSPDNKGFEKLVESMTNSFAEKGTIESKQKNKYKGYQTIDMKLLLNENLHYNFRMVKGDKNAYLLMIGTSKKEPEQEKTNRFYNSLEMMTGKGTDAIVFKSDTGAYSIIAPTGFKLTSNDHDENYSSVNYSGFDFTTKALYSVTYADYKPGTHFTDLDELYNTMVADVKESIKKEPESVTDSTLDGYPGRRYHFIASDNSFMYLQYYLRDSRVYIVIGASRESNQREEILKRINSFRFLPARTKPLSNYKSANFSAMMPGVVKIENDTTDFSTNAITTSYLAGDVFSGNSFVVFEKKLSPYFYAKNDSTYFNEQLNKYKNFSDSVTYQHIFKKDNLSYCDYKTIPEKNKYGMHRMRFINNGQSAYMLHCFLSDTKENDSIAQLFFDSFRITIVDKSFSIYKPKLDLILKDLHQKDTIIQHTALKSFQSYTIDSSDVNQLKAALNGSFTDDTSAYDKNTRYFVLNEIYNHQTKSEVVQYVKSTYDQLTANFEIRTNALHQLANSQSEEGIILLKKYLLKNPPQPDEAFKVYQTISPLQYDSVPEAKILFPEIFGLINDSSYKRIVYSLTANCLGKKIIGYEIVQPHQKEILAEAEKEYAETKKPRAADDYFYSPTFSSAYEILAHANADESVSHFQNLVIADTVCHEKHYSFFYLIHNNLSYDKNALNKFLSKPNYRISFYDLLKGINRIDAYPAKLLKQQYFAECDLYWSLDYDEMYPEKIELLEERKELNNGAMMRYYLFEITFSGEENTNAKYLGIAGPYPLEDGKIYTSGTYTSCTYETPDRKKIDEQFNTFIDEWKKLEKDNNAKK